MWLDIAAAMQHMLPHAPPQSTHDTVCTYKWEDTYKTLVGVMHTFGCLLCLKALPNTVMTGLSLSRAKGRMDKGLPAASFPKGRSSCSCRPSLGKDSWTGQYARMPRDAQGAAMPSPG